jgi:TRAP-type transport system periplasmic protein
VMYLKNNVVLAGNAKKLKVEEVETPASIRTSIETFQSNNVKEVIEAARSDAAIPNSDQMAERVLALIDKWRDLVAGIDAKDVDAVAALYRKELFDKIDLSTLE